VVGESHRAAGRWCSQARPSGGSGQIGGVQARASSAHRAHSSRDSATTAGVAVAVAVVVAAAAAALRLFHGVMSARLPGTRPRAAIGQDLQRARHWLTSLLEIRGSWLNAITPHGATHARERRRLRVLPMWVGLLLESRLCIELGVLRGIGELPAIRIRVIEIHYRHSLATSHNSV
jgi:hypothetical protein